MTILNNTNSVLAVLNKEKILEDDSELRLVKKANELARKNNYKVISMIIGNDIDKNIIEKVSRYSNDVIVYDSKALKLFEETMYSMVVKEFINKNNPEFLLMNNDDFGKVICSRVAGYFDTSVLTNCENLNINSDGELIEIKNINNSSLEILNKAKKLKIATLNLKKINLKDVENSDKANIYFENIETNLLERTVEILEHYKIKNEMSIEKAEVLVVAGKGVKAKEDLKLIETLARALNGEVAFTRPLVQLGWGDHVNQVGISGTAVKPKVIVTVGVSGAFQFTNAMDKSEYIISINTDSKAPIFKIAHCGIVGDLYEIIPRLLDRIN